LGFITVFHLFDSKIEDGSEIYSILRPVRLRSTEFINRHYDDGTFHCKDVSDP